MSNTPIPDVVSFQWPEALRSTLKKMGFDKPTPIQEQAIPAVLGHRDLIGCAQTGTGKTGAFAIPIIATLIKRPEQNALILVPTRELAMQVMDVIQQLTAGHSELKLAVLIGGMPMPAQNRALAARPRIVVATPGRLCDHLRRGSLSLSKTAVLVLDEADRMLDMGFAPQLNEILRFLPRARQTLLFSATLPPDILKLAMKFLKDPVQVTVGKVSQAVPLIEQKTLEVTREGKNVAVLDALNARAAGTALVFVRTQSRTDRLARYLESYGVAVARIHGGRTQGQRTRALDGFRNGTVRVLVATDIAARGLDIDHVAHVINYDLPQVPEDYIHRIGRTGRAGRSGEALSLIAADERALWRDIDRLLKKSGSGAVEALKPEATSAMPALSARKEVKAGGTKAPSRVVLPGAFQARVARVTPAVSVVVSGRPARLSPRPASKLV